ncbi:Protein of unknown function (DUF2874) [Opitutaceae bacterium TAV1]|nr:Protein of unknown function (DUF2874) [Opitutaceae bacterium TAV1]
MKNLLLFSVLLALLPALRAGDLAEAQVPAVIVNHVKQQYPKAGPIKWDFEKDDGVYEAEFRIDGFEHDLEFTPAGERVYSKIEIPVSSLPAAVTAYVTTHHPKAKILGAKHIVKGDRQMYDVGISEGPFWKKKHKNLYLDEQGVVVSK